MEAKTPTELAQANKELSAFIAQLQERRSVLLSVYQRREKEAKAKKAVRTLSPEDRAALRRMLELQDEEDKLAKQADKVETENLAAAVTELDGAVAPSFTPPPEEKDPTKLTEAQRSAILLAQETK